MTKYNKLHLHSDHSNGVTSIDSVTKFNEYIERAAEEGMTAIAFTEHGCVFDWLKKKECCEEHGIKYIHAVEMYITKTLDEKIRDNYHCCMYSKNYEGFLELNKLVSKGFNRNDGSYYYNPRITLDDLLNTSDNIIITSACLGGFFKTKDDEVLEKFLSFMIKNKHRCFLEIQHHLVKVQSELNEKLYQIHKETGLRLICGTDTHALNERHAKGRVVLQKAKGIFFEDEEGWDLTFKSYDELIRLYKKQNSIPLEDVKIALNNTLVLSDMVKDFEVDKSYKYPKLYEDGVSVLKQKINEGVARRGINKYPNYRTEYIPRIMYELETYIHNGAVDFLHLDDDIKNEMRNKKIYPGYSRGSCSGSLIAYLIGMTDIDSIKHKMNFERFMNKERVSLADVDTDWQPNHRETVKDYIYNKEGLYCADIITFNTVALKGAIRDVCRALYQENIPLELRKRADRDEAGYGKLTDETSKLIKDAQGNYLKVANYICENVETNETKMRKEYPEVFEYVDIINGAIVSIGTHPCGTICSPIPLDDVVGLCTISTCSRPVSMLSMKCIDAQNFTKLDILGLDNVQIINEVCEMVGIERLTPDNVPDEEVIWKSMAEDNLLIFQWESDSAGAFLKSLLSEDTLNKIREVNPNFRYVDLVSMGNGAIRPAGASYRDALSNGVFRDNGHKVLNEFLAPTMGYLVYQEQILEFLNRFCGYTMGEADIVRRGFSKKIGTEEFIPKIKEGFIKTMKDDYDVSEEESEKLIVNFIQIIRAASDYLFSLNHSEPYTYIGYVCAYLKYYYPLEFLTVALNINMNNQEKTAKIIEFAKKKNINIKPPEFGYSKGEGFFDKGSNSIYKGIGSVKNLNNAVGDGLFEIASNNKNITFLELLLAENSCNSRQMETLIKLDFFKSFGKAKKLLLFYEIFRLLKDKKAPKKKTINRDVLDKGIISIIEKNSEQTESTYKNFKWLSTLEEVWNYIKDEDISLIEKIKFQNEILGYIDYNNDSLDKRYVLVTELDTKYSPVVNTYCLNNGVTCKCKINKRLFNEKPLSQNDIIYIHSMEKKFGFKKVADKKDSKGKLKPIFEEDKSKIEWWITNYSIINDLEEAIDINE